MVSPEFRVFTTGVLPRPTGICDTIKLIILILFYNGFQRICNNGRIVLLSKKSEVSSELSRYRKIKN